MKPKVVVIAAVGLWGEKMVIGQDNQLPWTLPRDMRFFRTVTLDSTVIMGRKTFESLGKRTLPKRRNIVVTRQADYQVKGGEVAHSLESAIGMAEGERYVFIIGGGELYKQAIPIADHILLTQISHHGSTEPLFPVFQGDTYFPEIIQDNWTCVKHSRWFRATSAKPGAQIPKDRLPSLQFRFLRYDRVRENEKMPPSPPKLFFRAGKLYRAKSPSPIDSQLQAEREQKKLPL